MEHLRVAGRVLVGRLRLMLRRNRLDDELRDEVRLHMDLRRQALIDGGMDPRQAEAEARRRFGNAMAIREETREMWGFPSLDTLTQDIRYGARLLRRSPTVTIASILSLAIGIGASAGVFSLTDAVLLRSLPVRSPGELRLLRWHSGPTSPYASLSGYSSGDDSGERSTSFSLDAFRQARLQARDAIEVIGFANLGQVNLSVNGVAALGEATAVSGNYFSVLGLSPVQGRLLGESDDRPEGFSVAIVSDEVWRTRFDASPEATGRSLVINGVPFTVVGVAPASFNGTGQVGSSPDVYVPLAANDHVFPDRGNPLDPNYWWVLMMGRLKPGSDPDSARGRLDLVVKQTVRAARPELADQDLPRVEVLPGAHGQLEERERLRDPLKLMSVVVGIVLLVACANVANLLLARGRARASELSVRIALGAPRRRIVRQLLTEGLILATMGSALGLLAARWVAGALLPALDVGFDPSLVGAGLNVRLLAFVAGLATLCVLLSALVPALRTTDMSVTAGLHESGRGSAASHRRRGVSVTLVVAQITLSMILVATAMLLVRSVQQLRQVNPGFDPSHLLTFRLAPGLNGYKPERVFEIYSSILERLRAAPGVEAASLSNYALISNGANIIVAARTDEPVVDRASPERSAFEGTHLAWRMAVESRFFETMRIRIDRGRTFDDRDSRSNQPVVVINRALAHQLFKTVDVVGRRFRVESRAGNPTYEIVGVCADALFASLRKSNPPTIYVPYRQPGVGAMTLEVRTAGDPIAFVPTAREIVRSVDANLPMLRVQTQDDQIAASISRERLFATLATWLGAVAVTLSAIGLYALLAYTVTLRTGEIGIRMALGANRGDVRWMIVRQSLLVALCGLGLGIAASVAGTNLLRALLFNIEPRDSATLALSAVLILVVSMIAGYIPARRASHVDPLTALRAE